MHRTNLVEREISYKKAPDHDSLTSIVWPRRGIEKSDFDEPLGWLSFRRILRANRWRWRIIARYLFSRKFCALRNKSYALLPYLQRFRQHTLLNVYSSKLPYLVSRFRAALKTNLPGIERRFRILFHRNFTALQVWSFAFLLHLQAIVSRLFSDNTIGNLKKQPIE